MSQEPAALAGITVDLYTNLPLTALPERYRSMCLLHQADSLPQLAAGAALWLDDQGLCLVNAQFDQPLRLSDSMLEKRLQGRSLLVQACGAAHGGLHVLDAFAGFGLDSLALINRGCEVTALERHPLVWLMLTDFVERMGMSVDAHCADALEVLAAPGQQWDVVYLDPMFPQRRKQALPNLGLQHLQQVTIGLSVSVEEVLMLARERARRQVVLKRRLKDPVLSKPSHQLKGQAVRFDVYR